MVALLDFILRLCRIVLPKAEVVRLRLYGIRVAFYSQGRGNLILAGDLSKVYIGLGSHFKSDTLVECSGGFSMGKYVHTSRGLTIFTTNHDVLSKASIPFGPNDIAKPVKIGDYVWIGANVNICPGAEIGEGAVIGMGATISGKVSPGAIVVGNNRIVGSRDMKTFRKLKSLDLGYK